MLREDFSKLGNRGGVVPDQQASGKPQHYLFRASSAPHYLPDNLCPVILPDWQNNPPPPLSQIVRLLPVCVFVFDCCTSTLQHRCPGCMGSRDGGQWVSSLPSNETTVIHCTTHSSLTLSWPAAMNSLNIPGGTKTVPCREQTSAHSRPAGTVLLLAETQNQNMLWFYYNLFITHLIMFPHQ